MKKGLFLLIALLTGLLNGSCQPGLAPSTPTAPPPSPTQRSPTMPPPAPTATREFEGGNVRIWLSWEPGEMEGLHQIIDAFQTKHPEIAFSVAYFSEGSLRQSIEELGDGIEPPTVLFGPSLWGPGLWQRGRIRDLTGLIDSELPLTILPLAWSQVLIEGSIIAIPLELQGSVIFRNRQLIPEAPTSVDGMVEAAQAIKEEGVFESILDFGFSNSVSHLSVCGGSLFDSEGEISLTTEVGVCWLSMLQSFGQVGGIVFNSEDDSNLFREGQTAWVIDTTDQAFTLARSIGEQDLKVDPWPTYIETERQLTSYVWTENAYLVSGANQKDLEASWAFIRFAVTAQAQRLLSNPQGARHIPTLIDLTLENRLMSEMVVVLANGVALPPEHIIEVWSEPLEAAVEDVAVQGAEPEGVIQFTLDALLSGP